jgi:hypothetical protein
MIVMEQRDLYIYIYICYSCASLLVKKFMKDRCKFSVFEFSYHVHMNLTGYQIKYL